MKFTILIVLALLPFIHSNAQTKKVAVISDVDRLYQKYKGMETATLFLAGETYTANIKIEYNTAKKPIAVIMYGFFDNTQSQIEDLMNNLIRSKEKAGYRYIGINSEYISPSEEELSRFCSVTIYGKGSQYAKYAVDRGLSISDWLDELGDTTITRKRDPNDYKGLFYFEVGDTKRKSSKPTEKFEF